MGAYSADKVLAIEILDMEDRYSGVYISFMEVYGNGKRNLRRVNVKALPEALPDALIS